MKVSISQNISNYKVSVGQKVNEVKVELKQEVRKFNVTVATTGERGLQGLKGEDANIETSNFNTDLLLRYQISKL